MNTLVFFYKVVKKLVPVLQSRDILTPLSVAHVILKPGSILIALQQIYSHLHATQGAVNLCRVIQSFSGTCFTPIGVMIKLDRASNMM